jgi:uncharacterized protein (TIGR02646 family)
MSSASSSKGVPTMRFVDLTRVRPLLPPDWEKRAAVACAEAATAAPDERSDAINRYRGLWRELVAILGSLSNRKCWYCESREDRSDKAVDHFRPKGRPVESNMHPGYWWLAFDWRNYRYSCTYCNSRRVEASDGTAGGKHSHFPLLDEDARAFEEAAIGGETPMLLDPTKRGDTTLLYFNQEGRVEPRVRKEQQPIHWSRGEISIELYHLNHKDIVEERMDLFNTIKRLIDTGHVCFNDWRAGNLAAEAGYEMIVERLQILIQERAEFSAAARDMILGFRDDTHPWIDAIL